MAKNQIIALNHSLGAPTRQAQSMHIAKFDRTDTDTNTDLLADFRARILARKSVCPVRAAAGRSAALTARSARRLVGPTFVRTRAFPREDVRLECARLHVYMYCT